MLSSILGKKIGMAQTFSQNGEVTPVTVIDIANWFVTQIKTPEKDGYAAVVLGLPRNKYAEQPFAQNWCRNKKKYFLHLQEIKIDESELEKIKVGKEIKLEDMDLAQEDLVKVTGNSKGLGFQGVMRRWGFGGGPSGHGSNFHRKPGAISHICSQGKVIKGKKLPGQTGNRRVAVKGLKIVDLNKENGCLFVKGAVPGKKDSLVIISKQG
jgi:large subunit ribosomal protein L3